MVKGITGLRTLLAQTVVRGGGAGESETINARAMLNVRQFYRLFACIHVLRFNELRRAQWGKSKSVLLPQRDITLVNES